MKDAFGKKLEVGDKVLYSTSNSSGTNYHIGQIMTLYLAANSKKSYAPPDRVGLKILESSDKAKFAKDPIVYASNVICLPVTCNVIWVPPSEDGTD